MNSANLSKNYDLGAMILRMGLGLVFVIGGLSKLSLLLNSATHDGMVANYMGTSGYINALFQDYLFASDGSGWITPSGFLTSLSAFELLSGIALMVGFMVRPLALFYAFLLWTFVVSLPVMTVPGEALDVKTYTSPALFVQIRDIAMSGLMFVLFNLGAGAKSLDKRFGLNQTKVNWDVLGLLLRFSLGLVFIVAGFFGGFANIPNFASSQYLLAALGVLLIFGSGNQVRLMGAVTIGVMLWYGFTKLNMDKNIVANLNGFKREFALAGAGAVLIMFGGGSLFTFSDILNRSKDSMRQIVATKAAKTE